MKTVLSAAIVVAALSPSVAAEVKITDLKVFVYLERAGKMSENLVGASGFVNLPKGGAPGGETATGVFVDLTFAGEKNSAPKFATATVDLTQDGRNGLKIVTHKAFTNFIFGLDGVEHKALFLEMATCMPLAIEVHSGKTAKSANFDFQCKE